MKETVERAGRRITLFDLSATLTNETRDVEPLPHEIEYFDHEQSKGMAEQIFGIEPDLWPTGHSWAAEKVTLSTHSGTHVDAPYHYGPSSEGEPAQAVDEIPLSWCFGDGFVLDFSDREPGYGITAEDVRGELDRIGYEVHPFDVALIRTDAYKRFDQENYDKKQPGMTREATEFLVEKGVRLMGIDAWGFDRPMDRMAEEARKGDPERLWEAHFYGKERSYLHIEKLAHLDKLPVDYGFRVFAFPYKVDSASAGWTRVVAMLEEEA